jgi:hypothetical protein
LQQVTSPQTAAIQDSRERKQSMPVETSSSTHKCEGIESWISGVNSKHADLCAQDLAQRLRAAAPECYED